ncbi:MAG: carbon storage regulator [Arenicellales bacterium]|jgi:carbon storage regulator CsrA
MLVLTRKPGESIILKHPDIEPIILTVLENGRLGIDAPAEVQIIREELLKDSTD